VVAVSFSTLLRAGFYLKGEGGGTCVDIPLPIRIGR